MSKMTASSGVWRSSEGYVGGLYIERTPRLLYQAVCRLKMTSAAPEGAIETLEVRPKAALVAREMQEQGG